MRREESSFQRSPTRQFHGLPQAARKITSGSPTIRPESCW